VHLEACDDLDLVRVPWQQSLPWQNKEQKRMQIENSEFGARYVDRSNGQRRRDKLKILGRRTRCSVSAARRVDLRFEARAACCPTPTADSHGLAFFVAAADRWNARPHSCAAVRPDLVSAVPCVGAVLPSFSALARDPRQRDSSTAHTTTVVTPAGLCCATSENICRSWGPKALWAILQLDNSVAPFSASASDLDPLCSPL
jgi:hypothetical protein